MLFCVNHTGTYRIDPDAFACQFASQAHSHSVHTSFGSSICCKPVTSKAAGFGGNIDDGPALATSRDGHQCCSLPNTVKGTEQIHCHNQLQRLRTHIQQVGRTSRHSSRVNKSYWPPKMTYNIRKESPHGLGARHVNLKGDGNASSFLDLSLNRCGQLLVDRVR